MKNLNLDEDSIINSHLSRREVVNIDQEQLVKTELFNCQQFLPLKIFPAIDQLNLVKWSTNNKDFINKALRNYGAILFRDFNVNGLEEFEKFIRAISQGDLLEYTYRSTRRTQIGQKIYTSTEYPPHQSIPLHNENAYSSIWPMKICFFCVEPATKGGETPIADSRKMFERLDPDIKKRFIQKKVMYVRNFGELDLSWQDVFQTTNRLDVESYCHQAGIEFEWKDSDRLRTRQVCQAVAKHPNTDEMVWFNQAHLFHISSLQPEIRESLLSIFGEDELPRNAYYGDGSPIETSILDEIRNIYQQEAVTFSWHQGDILLLDNMLTAHGRMPFSGERKVVVGMSEVCITT